MFSHQNNNPKAINKKAMFITALLVQYVILGTMFYFMHHVESIKDCGDCNYEEWQQKYLKYYALFMIFVVTVKPLINKDVNLKKNMVLSVLLDTVIISAIIIMFYALYKFTRKLNEDACNCLTQGKREAYNLLYIYSYVPFLYIFGFIVMTVYLILNQVL